MGMMAYQMRFGTPEKQVPTAYSPPPQIEVCCGLPAGAPPIRAEHLPRGMRLSLPLRPKTKIYGLGLQLKSFEHSGTKKLLRVNADPVADTGDSHAPVPFFVTTEGWGLFVDTARSMTVYAGYEADRDAACGQDGKNTVALSTDVLYARREVTRGRTVLLDIPAAAGVDVYFFTGDTVTEIVTAYNAFSGLGCMPPLWGLGNLYRCCAKFGAQQILQAAGTLRKERIPCDVLGLEPGWQTHSYACSFVWDQASFPDPRGLLTELSAMGFHTDLWEHAFVHESSPLFAPLRPYSGDVRVWSGLVPDLSLPEAQEIFARYHEDLAAQGVAGFKLDECDGSDYTGSWSFPDCTVFPSGLDGEQMHALFGALYCQTVQRALGERRTFSQCRQMGALASAYPFVLYSDLYDHKEFIRGIANAGLSGLLWSPEVRHATDAQDLIRRLQTVVFSARSIVNGWYLDHFPWEELGCTDAVRKLLDLRMSLIPYLYTAFYDYATTGKPPIRPLVADYTDDPETYEADDCYLLGDALLVAPIVSGQKGRQVYLPAGEWYDFFTGERVQSGHHTVETDGIPVYVRGGTLFPFARPEPFIRPDTCFSLTLRRYGDQSHAICRLIEDDGLTRGTAYTVLRFTEKEWPQSFRYRVQGVE